MLNGMFTEEELDGLTWGEAPEGFNVIEKTIIEKSRWAVLNKIVLQNEVTKEFYIVQYRSAATEYQDCEPDFAVFLAEAVPSVTYRIKE